MKAVQDATSCKSIAEELFNMQIADVETMESPEVTMQHIRRIMEVGKGRFETRHRHKDGKTLDIEVSVNYLDVNGGWLFVFLHDVTERKRRKYEPRNTLTTLW